MRSANAFSILLSVMIQIAKSDRGKFAIHFPIRANTRHQDDATDGGILDECFKYRCRNGFRVAIKFLNPMLISSIKFAAPDKQQPGDSKKKQ